MNCAALKPGRYRKFFAGFTLIEILTALGVGSIVLAVAAVLSIFGARCFAAMSNYTDLDRKSRYALDVMLRQIREATLVVGFQTNLPVKSLAFINANTSPIQTNTLTWYSDDPTSPLVFQTSGHPPQTNLTQCDRWDFALYQRTPSIYTNNIIFYPATNAAGIVDPSLCKLIDMSWKCSRTILGHKLNTETVQSAQIVLRNKH